MRSSMRSLSSDKAAETPVPVVVFMPDGQQVCFGTRLTEDESATGPEADGLGKDPEAGNVGKGGGGSAAQASAEDSAPDKPSGLGRAPEEPEAAEAVSHVAVSHVAGGRRCT